jgi:hypothetical protein
MISLPGNKESLIARKISRFYVVRTVHFGMKLYNDQRSA